MKYLFFGTVLLLALAGAAIGLAFAIREFNSSRDDRTGGGEENEEADQEEGPAAAAALVKFMSEAGVECESENLDDLIDFGLSEEEAAAENPAELTIARNTLETNLQGPVYDCTLEGRQQRYAIITATDDLVRQDAERDYAKATDPELFRLLCEKSDDPQLFSEIYRSYTSIAFMGWVISSYADHEADLTTYDSASAIDELSIALDEAELGTEPLPVIEYCDTPDEPSLP